MKDRLIQIGQLVDSYKLELETYFKDKSISIDERWELLKFAKKIGIGNDSDRTDFGLNRDDEFLYEGPLYMDKHETRDVFSILDSLKSDDSFNLTEDEELTFKNYCLDGFYTSMSFYW